MKRGTLLVIHLLLFCMLCSGCSTGATASAPADGSRVHGKVTVDRGQKPVAGVRLMAYPAASHSLAGTAPLVSEKTGADGLFSLSLAPGDYYFIARGEGFFSYYGRNPVTVPEGGLQEMNLGLVEEAPPVPETEAQIDTGVLGSVSVDGKPLAGVVVYVYTDLNEHLKGRGLGMTAATNESGIFQVSLPPGTYYLVARQRQGGGYAGPLSAGDYIGYYPGNPLVVRQGAVSRVAIPMLEVPEKVERMASTLFGQTSIHGRILNADGRPLAGMRAVLYADPMMLNRPLYVSQPSDEGGRFVLSFPRGGTYYIAARDTIGGTPQPGEFYGRYGGSDDSSIVLATGEALEGIDIVVEKVW